MQASSDREWDDTGNEIQVEHERGAGIEQIQMEERDIERSEKVKREQGERTLGTQDRRLFLRRLRSCPRNSPFCHARTACNGAHPVLSAVLMSAPAWGRAHVCWPWARNLGKWEECDQREKETDGDESGDTILHQSITGRRGRGTTKVTKIQRA